MVGYREDRGVGGFDGPPDSSRCRKTSLSAALLCETVTVSLAVRCPASSNTSSCVVPSSASSPSNWMLHGVVSQRTRPSFVLTLAPRGLESRWMTAVDGSAGALSLGGEIDWAGADVAFVGAARYATAPTPTDRAPAITSATIGLADSFGAIGTWALSVMVSDDAGAKSRAVDETTTWPEFELELLTRDDSRESAPPDLMNEPNSPVCKKAKDADRPASLRTLSRASIEAKRRSGSFSRHFKTIASKLGVTWMS